MAGQSKRVLARDAYLNLVRLQGALTAEFTELFREAGLTTPQYNVLRILLGGPSEGAPCQYIGARLLTRVPDVTRLLDRMVAAGFVTRARRAEDRRIVLIRVTAPGRKLCNRLAEPVMDLHVAQFSRMPAAALAELNQGLEAALQRR